MSQTNKQKQKKAQNWYSSHTGFAKVLSKVKPCCVNGTDGAGEGGVAEQDICDGCVFIDTLTEGVNDTVLFVMRNCGEVAGCEEGDEDEDEGKFGIDDIGNPLKAKEP